MQALPSFLSSQLSELSEEREKNIDIVDIRLFPESDQNQFTVRFSINSTQYSTEIQSLPNPEKIIRKFANYLRTVTSDLSLPKNCYLTKAGLDLKDTPLIELSFYFQVPRAIQRSTLSMTRQLIPSEIEQKDNFYFTGTVIFFHEYDFNHKLDFLTTDKHLANNPPTNRTLETNLTSPKEISEEAGVLGSENPLWQYGKTTIPLPAYKVTYENKQRKRTFENQITKQVQSLTSNFDKPTQYKLTGDNLTLTNGKSTGRYLATLTCPITET